MKHTMSKCIAAAALLLLASRASSTELVVIASNAPAYAPGKAVDAAIPLVLAAEQFVVIATEDGQVVRIDGPHDAPISSEPSPEGRPPATDDVVGALARLFGSPGPELGGIAGARGGADEETIADSRPDAWLIHAERTGDQCFIPARAPELWREVPTGTVAAEVEDLVAHATVRLEWADAQQRTAWPAVLSPQSGRVYLVRPEGELSSVAIRLQALPRGLAGNDLASVAWLAAKGCTPQARLLLGQIVARDSV